MLYENGLSVTHDARCDDCRRRPTGPSSAGCGASTSGTAIGKPKRNVLAERHTIDGVQGRALDPADRASATSSPPSSSPRRRPARRASAFGRYQADLRAEGYAWTRRASPADLFKPGDLVEVAVTKLDEAAGTATVTLEQTPVVEGALVAIDNRTGQIKAMVGGWNFNRSKFNRAVQAYRQLGSTFKPIVYTAAIDRGFTPTSILVDAPVSYPAGNGRSTARRTTTTSSKARSRCGGRSRSRATSRRSR